MSTRLRTFIIAIALSLCASAIGLTLLLINNDSIPLVHIVTDLQAHYAALNEAPNLGLGTPAYDSSDSKNPNLGVIRIDELTYGSNVKILHQFPFPRSVYGTLLQHLAKAGAKAVVFDIDFLDPAPNPA